MAAEVLPRPAACSADFDYRLLGRVSDTPAASGLHAFGAISRTPIEPRASLKAPGGCYQLCEIGGYSPARQVCDYSPRVRAHHSSDTTHDQSHRSPDREFAPESQFHQGSDFARAPRPAPSVPPGPSAKGPSGKGPSRAVSSERAQARYDAIRAEERHIDAILRAKQRDLQLVSDQLQSLESGRRTAEEYHARREFQQHQRDAQAFQAEADRLDKEHRARLLQFHREERELEFQLARERTGDDQVRSHLRFQRNYPPRRCRRSPTRPSTHAPSAVIASATAPLL